MQNIDKKIITNFLGQLMNDMDPKHRADIAESFAISVRRQLGIPRPSEKKTSALDEQGYLNLGKVLSQEQCEQIRAYFLSRDCYPAHVNNQDLPPCSIEQARELGHFASYNLSDVIEAPYLYDIFTSDKVIETIQNYLGCPPSLYSLNAWWSLSGHEAKAQVTQNFHRDPDDLKFCALFIYLTDVDDQSAPQLYVRQSHNYKLFEQIFYKKFANSSPDEDVKALFASTFIGDGNNEDLEQLIVSSFSEYIEKVEGPAGTAFITDSYGLHRGSNPKSKDRLVVWARYGLGLNHSLYLDNTEPVKVDCSHITDEHKYLTRLIIGNE